MTSDTLIAAEHETALKANKYHHAFLTDEQSS